MTSADLLVRHLSLAGRAATPEDLEIYTSDVVVEFPYAPEDHTQKLEGPAAVARFLEKIGSFAEGFRIGTPTVLDTADGFVAEYHGDAIFKDTGKPYSQDYIVVVKVQGGRIAHIREYYDPLRVLRAMGEIE